MQNINDKNGKLIGISYDSIIKKIKAANSIKEKLELFIKLPFVFWNFESMKQILGPFATIAALKMWDSLGSEKNFPSLNAVFNNKKKVIKAQPILETMSAFLKRDIRMKRTDFVSLGKEEVIDGLYNLIKEGLIENTQELKKYCDSQMEFILGHVILRLVLDELDFMFKNRNHSKIASGFKISDDLITLVITNYIAYVSKENTCCYDIGDYLETEEEKWMAKVVFYDDNIPSIKPVYILKYLALKSLEGCNLDNCDIYLYEVFFDLIRARSNIKGSQFSSWNLDLQRKLFLVSCTIPSVWRFSLKDSLQKFLTTLEWDEEEIVTAFTKTLVEKRSIDFGNLGSCLTEDIRFTYDISSLGIEMLCPVIRAIINGTDLGDMKDFLYGLLVRSETNENDFKSGIEVCFNEMSKLSDYKKITLIVALIETRFLCNNETYEYELGTLLGKALYRKGGGLKKKIKQFFDKAFEKGISSSDLCSYDLLKMVEHRKILGLTNGQIRLIRDRALKLDRTKEHNKKLFELFDTKEFKIILEGEGTENRIFVDKKGEADKESAWLNLEEDDEEEDEENKNKNENENKDADVRKSVRKKLVLRKIKNKSKSKPNMMLDKKCNRQRDEGEE